jgi:hypothetical protein
VCLVCQDDLCNVVLQCVWCVRTIFVTFFVPEYRPMFFIYKPAKAQDTEINMIKDIMILVR